MNQGLYFEELALTYLKNKGFSLVEKNVRYSFGEIDLIMKDKEELVFVEVRFRKNDLFGSAKETVTRSKQKKLIMAAQAYLKKYKVEPSCRFDVVAITGNVIEHISHAFMDY